MKKRVSGDQKRSSWDQLRQSGPGWSYSRRRGRRSANRACVRCSSKMSESDSEWDDITTLPAVARPRAEPAAASSSSADSGDKSAEAAAAEAARAAKAAAAKRSRTFSPPPEGWKMTVDVLQADGAKMVDTAVARVFGGREASDTSISYPKLLTQRTDIELWAGEPIEPLVHALRDEQMIALDLEWPQAASVSRPRPSKPSMT